MTEQTTTKATPTRRKDTMPTKTKTDSLPHADWCKAERIETTDYPDRGISTRHCMDCGAHEAQDRRGKILATPAVTGALSGHGRGDMDVSLEQAPATRDTSAPWHAHADNLTTEV